MSCGGRWIPLLPAAVRIWRKKTGAITITTITTILQASWVPITTIITIINTRTLYYILARRPTAAEFLETRKYPNI
jgi:hypothetical protein